MILSLVVVLVISCSGVVKNSKQCSLSCHHSALDSVPSRPFSLSGLCQGGISRDPMISSLSGRGAR